MSGADRRCGHPWSSMLSRRRRGRDLLHEARASPRTAITAPPGGIALEHHDAAFRGQRPRQRRITSSSAVLSLRARLRDRAAARRRRVAVEEAGLGEGAQPPAGRRHSRTPPSGNVRTASGRRWSEPCAQASPDPQVDRHADATGKREEMDDGDWSSRRPRRWSGWHSRFCRVRICDMTTLSPDGVDDPPAASCAQHHPARGRRPGSPLPHAACRALDHHRHGRGGALGRTRMAGRGELMQASASRKSPTDM